MIVQNKKDFSINHQTVVINVQTLNHSSTILSLLVRPAQKPLLFIIYPVTHAKNAQKEHHFSKITHALSAPRNYLIITFLKKFVRTAHQVHPFTIKIKKNVHHVLLKHRNSMSLLYNALNVHKENK